jgi:transposase
MERKVKYNYEFKLRCVEEVLKGGHSIIAVVMANGFDESNLRKWISFYQKFGNGGLLPRANQNYSLDFKVKVLQSIEKEFLPLNEACLKFNISSKSVILNWQRKYSEESILGLENKPKGKPVDEIQKSRKEIQ